jgi:hypothetical protein
LASRSAAFFSCFSTRRSWTFRSRAIFAIVVCRFALIEPFLSLGSALHFRAAPHNATHAQRRT